MKCLIVLRNITYLKLNIIILMKDPIDKTDVVWGQSCDHYLLQDNKHTPSLEKKLMSCAVKVIGIFIVL